MSKSETTKVVSIPAVLNKNVVLDKGAFAVFANAEDLLSFGTLKKKERQKIRFILVPLASDLGIDLRKTQTRGIVSEFIASWAKTLKDVYVFEKPEFTQSEIDALMKSTDFSSLTFLKKFPSFRAIAREETIEEIEEMTVVTTVDHYFEWVANLPRIEKTLEDTPSAAKNFSKAPEGHFTGVVVALGAAAYGGYKVLKEMKRRRAKAAKRSALIEHQSKFLKLAEGGTLPKRDLNRDLVFTTPANETGCEVCYEKNANFLLTHRTSHQVTSICRECLQRHVDGEGPAEHIGFGDATLCLSDLVQYEFISPETFKKRFAPVIHKKGVCLFCKVPDLDYEVLIDTRFNGFLCCPHHDFTCLKCGNCSGVEDATDHICQMSDCAMSAYFAIKFSRFKGVRDGNPTTGSIGDYLRNHRDRWLQETKRAYGHAVQVPTSKLHGGGIAIEGLLRPCPGCHALFEQDSACSHHDTDGTRCTTVSCRQRNWGGNDAYGFEFNQLKLYPTNPYNRRPNASYVVNENPAYQRDMIAWKSGLIKIADESYPFPVDKDKFGNRIVPWDSDELPYWRQESGAYVFYDANSQQYVDAETIRSNLRF